MVSDLQNSTELVGMSVDEVRELLGTPDDTDTATCLRTSLHSRLMR